MKIKQTFKISIREMPDGIDGTDLHNKNEQKQKHGLI